jgi:hypothetical protein
MDPKTVFRIGFLGDETEEEVPNGIRFTGRARLRRPFILEVDANKRLRAPGDEE